MRLRRTGLVFRDGCPGGESPKQVGARVDRVIARAHAFDSDVALFAHGHVLRVLGARWIGLSACGGQHFLLSTGTISVLSYYRGVPALRIGNAPLHVDSVWVELVNRFNGSIVICASVGWRFVAVSFRVKVATPEASLRDE